MRVRLLLVLALVLAAPTLVSAPASAAALRYASPTGTSAQSCATPATACNIEKAIGSAANGDEVVLAPGTYVTASSLSSSATQLTVRGAEGQPRPVLDLSANTGLSLNGTGAEVYDLAVRHSGSGTALSVFARDVVVERVDVRSTEGEACDAGVSGVWRDSLCVTYGPGSDALEVAYTSLSPGTIRLRNVTAVATGSGSTGIRFYSGNDTTAVMNLRNVIASGSVDLRTDTDGSGVATLTSTRSNYNTVDSTAGGTVTTPGSGTNQLAAPVFADTLSFHQARTSPTVDAGAADADTGVRDLDGDARPQGATFDIGADELVPDTQPPTTALLKHPKKKTTKKRARFVFSSNEAGSVFFCRVDKRPAKPCTSPFRKRFGKLGKHKFWVYAVDPSGNDDRTPVRYVWRVRAKHA